MAAGSLKRTDEGIIVRCRSYRDGWYEAGVEYAPATAPTAKPIPAATV